MKKKIHISLFIVLFSVSFFLFGSENRAFNFKNITPFYLTQNKNTEKSISDFSEKDSTEIKKKIREKKLEEIKKSSSLGFPQAIMMSLITVLIAILANSKLKQKNK